MADLTDKKTAFTNQAIQAAEDFLAVYNRMLALRDKWVAQGLQFTDDDFVAPNAHMTAAKLTAIITTIEALDTWLTANFHTTNLHAAARS